MVDLIRTLASQRVMSEKHSSSLLKQVLGGRKSV